MKGNLTAFKKLIKKYRSLNEEDMVGDAESITGFGNNDKCILCVALGVHIATKFNCENCTYMKLTGSLCFQGVNNETYKAIDKAYKSSTLLKAYKARADYMENLINNKTE